MCVSCNWLTKTTHNLKIAFVLALITFVGNLIKTPPWRPNADTNDKRLFIFPYSVSFLFIFNCCSYIEILPTDIIDARHSIELFWLYLHQIKCFRIYLRFDVLQLFRQAFVYFNFSFDIFPYKTFKWRQPPLANLSLVDFFSSQNFDFVPGKINKYYDNLPGI